MTRLREVIEKEINTSTAEILEENKINGRLLLLMKKDDITEIIKPLGDRLALLEFISKITKNDHNHDMAWLTTSSTSPQASTSSQASDITKKEFFEQKAKGSKAATQALRDWNCLNSKIRREVIATKWHGDGSLGPNKKTTNIEYSFCMPDPKPCVYNWEILLLKTSFTLPSKMKVRPSEKQEILLKKFEENEYITRDEANLLAKQLNMEKKQILVYIYTEVCQKK
jgi:hypothetical protein